MGESVLCGVIRVYPSKLKSVGLIRERLEEVVPFVYRSQPRGVTEDDVDLPVIVDRFDEHESFVNGLHTSLRSLRQPILYLSSTVRVPRVRDLQQLVHRWNECPNRLSGVFFGSEMGEKNTPLREPGLYASPLLPVLRQYSVKDTARLKALLENEPIQTVVPEGQTHGDPLPY